MTLCCVYTQWSSSSSTHAHTPGARPINPFNLMTTLAGTWQKLPICLLSRDSKSLCAHTIGEVYSSQIRSHSEKWIPLMLMSNKFGSLNTKGQKKWSGLWSSLQKSDFFQTKATERYSFTCGHLQFEVIGFTLVFAVLSLASSRNGETS